MAASKSADPRCYLCHKQVNTAGATEIPLARHKIDGITAWICGHSCPKLISPWEPFGYRDLRPMSERFKAGGKGGGKRARGNSRGVSGRAREGLGSRKGRGKQRRMRKDRGR